MLFITLRVPKLCSRSSGNVALHHLFWEMQYLRAAAVKLGSAALLGVKVVLPRFARDNLPLTGNFKTLGECLVRFHTSILFSASKTIS